MALNMSSVQGDWMGQLETNFLAGYKTFVNGWETVSAVLQEHADVINPVSCSCERACDSTQFVMPQLVRDDEVAYPVPNVQAAGIPSPFSPRKQIIVSSGNMRPALQAALPTSYSPAPKDTPQSREPDVSGGRCDSTKENTAPLQQKPAKEEWKEELGPIPEVGQMGNFGYYAEPLPCLRPPTSICSTNVSTAVRAAPWEKWTKASGAPSKSQMASQTGSSLISKGGAATGQAATALQNLPINVDSSAQSSLEQYPASPAASKPVQSLPKEVYQTESSLISQGSAASSQAARAGETLQASFENSKLSYLERPAYSPPYLAQVPPLPEAPTPVEKQQEAPTLDIVGGFQSWLRTAQEAVISIATPEIPKDVPSALSSEDPDMDASVGRSTDEGSHPKPMQIAGSGMAKQGDVKEATVYAHESQVKASPETVPARVSSKSAAKSVLSQSTGQVSASGVALSQIAGPLKGNTLKAGRTDAASMDRKSTLSVSSNMTSSAAMALGAFAQGQSKRRGSSAERSSNDSVIVGGAPKAAPLAPCSEVGDASAVPDATAVRKPAKVATKQNSSRSKGPDAKSVISGLNSSSSASALLGPMMLGQPKKRSARPQGADVASVV